jgi:hypothetical protein
MLSDDQNDPLAAKNNLEAQVKRIRTDMLKYVTLPEAKFKTQMTEIQRVKTLESIMQAPMVNTWLKLRATIERYFQLNGLDSEIEGVLTREINSFLRSRLKVDTIQAAWDSENTAIINEWLTLRSLLILYADLYPNSELVDEIRLLQSGNFINPNALYHLTCMTEAEHPSHIQAFPLGDKIMSKIKNPNRPDDQKRPLYSGNGVSKKNIPLVNWSMLRWLNTSLDLRNYT